MQTQRLPGLIPPNSFFSTYLNDYNKVDHLYEFDPTDIRSYRERMSWLQNGYRQHRDVLVTTLAEYNQALGCGPATLHNLGRLAGTDALAVVTGQQAGVATGPLYTIYKAITAVQLARKLERELGVPVVPVFWVASEDHDYQEINHVNILRWAKQPSVKKIALAGYASGRQPIGTIPVDVRTNQFVTDLAYYLPETTYKQQVVDTLNNTVRFSSNLAEWFARLLTTLMGKYGLIIADPMLPGLRQLLRPFFQKAVQENRQIQQVLAECGEKISALGFQPAFSAAEEFTGIFTIMQDQRFPLHFEANGLYSSAGRSSWDFAQVMGLIERNPELFSCSAVLRPVAQDMLFPTAAYVGGPGEIAYFGQLKGVYQIFGQQMPVLFPRQSYTLIEPEAARIIAENMLTIDDLRNDFTTVVSRLLQQKAGQDVTELFRGARARICAEHQNLAGNLNELGGDLSKLMPANLARILYQFDYLEKKSNQQLRKKYRSYVNELHFAAKSVFPNENLQERVFNIIPYLARYGSDWFHELIEADLAFGFDHQAVYLERPM